MQEIKDRNEKIYEIDGKKGNGYYWSQKMRAIETEIRKTKDEINALKAFGNSEPQIKDLRDRIKAFQAKYDEISEVTGIAKDPKRLTVQKPTITSGVASGGNKSPIIPITDKTINSVKNVKISGFSDEQNAYIQEQHKELLRYARDNNNSNEVAFVFRKGLTNKTVFTGNDDVIDFGNGLNGKGGGLFIMHNHPRNSSFSDLDIRTFISNNDIKGFSIVKNNGEVETIIKTDKYSIESVKAVYRRTYKKFVKIGTKSEIDKAIKYILSKNGGIIEWKK